MKKLISLLVIPLLFIGCSIFEDEDERTYYDVTGIGYVYYKETKEPVPDARVSVMSTFRSNGYATIHPISEYYTTNSSGYFCVKFLKRTRKENVRSYYIAADKDNYKYNIYEGRGLNFTAEEFQQAKGTIQIDTLWLEYNPLWIE